VHKEKERERERERDFIDIDYYDQGIFFSNVKHAINIEMLNGIGECVYEKEIAAQTSSALLVRCLPISREKE